MNKISFSIKKIVKIAVRFIAILILLVLMIGIALSLPFVQTKLGHSLTNWLNEKYKISINVEQVSITVFGGVKLKKVLILDHHKDTLIAANRIKTNILDLSEVAKGDLVFDDIVIDSLRFRIKTYKERLSNLDQFIAAFDSKSPKPLKPFLFISDYVKITNGQFSLIDENKLNPKIISFSKLNLSAHALKIYGTEVSTTLNKLSLQDTSGLFVENLKAKFSYTDKQIQLENLDLKTKKSKLNGSITMNYIVEDFSQFTDKVQFDIKLEKATIASNEIRYFYNELGKNLLFKIKGKIKGPLNNLRLTNLKISDSKNTQIVGKIHFKNLFSSKENTFFMNGKFTKITTSYTDLKRILPNILGKSLPPILTKFGQINYSGTAQVTRNSLVTKFSSSSDLGILKSNLKISNFNQTEKATYIGNVQMENFNLGKLTSQKDIGKTNLNLDVKGRGFSKKSLNTALQGKISKLQYHNYSYSNLELDGNFVKGVYKMKLKANDPNLKMNFDGIIDNRLKWNRYDFKLLVENANLNKLHFMKDSISSFRGEVDVNLTGNNLDNLVGSVFINQTSYQNTKSTYYFDDFYINSAFDQNNVRTIQINSKDIIEGQIVGKFQFNQLKKLVTNALGSLYTNFNPEKVKKQQFIKFDFVIHNKIFEIFYPDISIASNTRFKGNLDSNEKEFKFNFNSPKVTAANTTFDNIRIKIDNKNPLYNAFLELDSIKTKYYKIRDFSLINVTKKDTLFFRSEFKGGTKGQDFFNLNLYHTINKDNNNVVGIQKSELKLKDYLWYLNEKDAPNNRVIFDKKLTNFTFDNFILSHENQEISFFGDCKGTNFKDLKLSFKNVDLNQITPANSKFVVNGNLDAVINYKQNNEIYQVPAAIKIANLDINKIKLGNLNFDILGDEKLKKFTVNSTLKNNNTTSLALDGNFEIIEKNTVLDLQLNLDRFNLGILAPLGGEVISNIRGFASGNASITGNLKKPEINGRLFVDEAGLKIPYLNVDYSLNNRTIVDLADEKFLFKNDVLTDIKYGTKGNLNGSIEHKNFSDWKLDLSINSNRLLVLDTQDKEDAAYYGQAFIDGIARIKGPTNALFIKVDAKSEKGTSLKIPINNSESVGENSFLHFLTAKEKFNLKKGIVTTESDFKGLELEFDLDITPVADIEVILDRNNGHGIKGNGIGNLLFKINTLGKFNMWGDFQVYDGVYNFKYGGLIDRKFNVKKGGSISWEGDPMKARLNLEAIYKTTANPTVLLENTSLNKKIDVNVVIGIRGDLTSPEPEFNFEFPTVGNVMKSEIEYRLTNKEVRETQALYLLSTGSFLSAEGLSQTSLSQSAYDTASSLLSKLIKSNNDKFQFDIGIVGADKTIGKETDGQFVASVSTKINERVTINGKLGVPFGGISQTAFVGNVEILYRVNEDGTLNLRFFNKENDISYIGEGIGYTQGLGLSYEVDFDTFKELINKIFKNKKAEKIPTSKAIDEDSTIELEKNDSQKSNNKNTKTVNPNIEGRVPEED